MTEAASPLWEVFIRPRNGLAHRHVGRCCTRTTRKMALESARDVYTRRSETLAIWPLLPPIVASASEGEGHDVRADRIQDLSAPDLL